MHGDGDKEVRFTELQVAPLLPKLNKAHSFQGLD